MKRKILLTIAVIIGISLLLGFIYAAKSYRKDNINTFNYEKKIFDDSKIHNINIIIKNEDWIDLHKNPTEKTKYKVDVVIDKKKIRNVSFNTKGNSSLNQVAEAPQQTGRYSFKIAFDHYEKDQTYHGLDILHLNNLYSDATYMKDYFSYDMFRTIGIPSPLTSYVFLKINGANYGIYLAVEDIGNSFLKRNQLDGKLYKPEQTSGIDRGASLTYVGEDRDKYQDIFNNATSPITEEDQTRMINSLKQLKNKENLEKVVDTKEIIKYFAAHNYLLSYDSYTGPSIHNYYLYEKDGKLSIFPWDYNMSFGSFGMGEDDNTIANYGIDTPLYKLTSDKRPLWDWIVSNEDYHQKYYKEMDELIKNYYESKEYIKKQEKIEKLITPYLTKEQVRFYNPEQVKNGIQMLKSFMEYRTQSIRSQLNGTISKKNEEQTNKIETPGLDLMVMGIKTGEHKTHEETTKEEPSNDNTKKHSSKGEKTRTNEE